VEDASRRESEELSAVIEELRVKNFEGYRKGSVKFTNGLNLIKGRNSAGKSTLLNALLFALYGQVPGVNKNLLVSRLIGQREMSVYVKFKNPVTGSSVEVYRSGRLDKKGGYKTTKLQLSLNGEEVQVESDEDLRRRVTKNIGASLKKFINLVYVSQGSLQDILEPRREDIDLILRLTVIRELKEQMDEVRRVFEKSDGKDVQTELQTLKDALIPRLREDLESLRKEIEELRSDFEKLSEQVAKAESTEFLNLLSNIKERERLETNLANENRRVKDRLAQAEVESHEELKNLINTVKREMEEAQKQAQELNDKERKTHNEWSVWMGKRKALLEEIEKHEDLLKKGVSTCPTCGQDLKEEKLQGILSDKRHKLQSFQGTEEEWKKQYDALDLQFQKISSEVIRDQNRLTNITGLESSVQNSLRDIERMESQLEALKEALSKDLAMLSLPFKCDDSELKIKVAQRLPLDPDRLKVVKEECVREKKRLEEKIEQQKTKNEDLKSKEQRLSMLESRLASAELAGRLAERFEKAIETRRRDVLKEIEHRALYYYERMTDQHDYDSVRIDPESYVVQVHPKNLAEHIPAMRDGGGHQTILALAVRLALLETLRFRCLLILDEPTYGVDADNLPQMAEYLGETSRLLSQTILVTHHDICEEEAANIIMVSRGSDGASHVQAKY